MSSFTSVGIGTNWSSASFIAEILAALKERRQAVGFSAPSYSAPAGTDVQSTSFWNTIQTDLEAIARYFCDPDIDPGTFTTTGIPYTGPYNDHNLTLAEWRSLAGMHEGGFRRATTAPSDWTELDDDAYSYGKMQYGDIIGPWIFDDLQRGLAALTSSILVYAYDTYEQRDSVYYRAKNKTVVGSGGDMAEALEDQIEKWNAASWIDSSTGSSGQMYCWWDYQTHVRTWAISGFVFVNFLVSADTDCTVYRWDLLNGNHGFGFCGGAGTILQTVSRGQAFSGTAEPDAYVLLTDLFRDADNPAELTSDPGYDLSYTLTATHAITKFNWSFTWDA